MRLLSAYLTAASCRLLTHVGSRTRAGVAGVALTLLVVGARFAVRERCCACVAGVTVGAVNALVFVLTSTASFGDGDAGIVAAAG